MVCLSINLELLLLSSIKLYNTLRKYVVYLLLNLIADVLSLCCYDGIFKDILICYFRNKRATINSHMLIFYPSKVSVLKVY